MGSGKGKTNRAQAKGKTALSSFQRTKARDTGAGQNVDLYSLFTPGTNTQVYAGEGVPLAKAEELAVMLVDVPEIRLVKHAGETVVVADADSEARYRQEDPRAVRL